MHDPLGVRAEIAVLRKRPFERKRRSVTSVTCHPGRSCRPFHILRTLAHCLYPLLSVTCELVRMFVLLSRSRHAPATKNRISYARPRHSLLQVLLCRSQRAIINGATRLQISLAASHRG